MFARTDEVVAPITTVSARVQPALLAVKPVYAPGRVQTSMLALPVPVVTNVSKLVMFTALVPVRARKMPPEPLLAVAAPARGDWASAPQAASAIDKTIKLRMIHSIGRPDSRATLPAQ